MVIIKRQRKKQKKKKEKTQRKGPEGTSIKIQFVGHAKQKTEQEHGDNQTTEEIVDMENINMMLEEEEIQCQEIQHVEQATSTKEYELRYDWYIDRALERMKLRKSKKHTQRPEVKPQEEPESAMETHKDAVDQ